MRVIIPLAGRGSRLRPWTATVPKSLLIYEGQPVLSHILDRLQRLDISEYTFVVGYRGAQIREWVALHYPNLPAIFIEQSDLNGTAHAIHEVRTALGDRWDGSPLLIVLGDVILNTDWQAFVEDGSSIGFYGVVGRKPYGILEMEGCHVASLREKPKIIDSAIAGCYFIRETPLFFQCLGELLESDNRTAGEYQLTDALQLLIDRGVCFRSQRVEKIDWESEYQ